MSNGMSPGTGMTAARQAGSSQGKPTRLPFFKPEKRQPEDGEENDHDPSPFVEQHHGREGRVGTGIYAVKGGTHVPEQTQYVDDTA